MRVVHPEALVSFVGIYGETDQKGARIARVKHHSYGPRRIFVFLGIVRLKPQKTGRRQDAVPQHKVARAVLSMAREVQIHSEFRVELLVDYPAHLSDRGFNLIQSRIDQEAAQRIRHIFIRLPPILEDLFRVARRVLKVRTRTGTNFAVGRCYGRNWMRSTGSYRDRRTWNSSTHVTAPSCEILSRALVEGQGQGVEIRFAA